MAHGGLFFVWNRLPAQASVEIPGDSETEVSAFSRGSADGVGGIFAGLLRSAQTPAKVRGLNRLASRQFQNLEASVQKLTNTGFRLKRKRKFLAVALRAERPAHIWVAFSTLR
jgi:hypothetical protein